MSSTTTTDTYTVAVFKDVAWASRGLDALGRQGFPPEALSIIAKESPETLNLIHQIITKDPDVLEIANVGRCVVTGTLVSALQRGGDELTRLGISGTMRYAGFQAHDGIIFEKLTARGGVLVAVRTEARAADALATFHSYGGGNAAIGAWHGRV